MNPNQPRKSILRRASSTKPTVKRVRFTVDHASPPSPAPNPTPSNAPTALADQSSPESTPESPPESPIDLTVTKTANQKCYGPAKKRPAQSTPSTPSTPKRQVPGLIPVNLLRAIENSTPVSTPNRLPKGTTVSMILNRL